jgi:hypothetical protein
MISTEIVNVFILLNNTDELINSAEMARKVLAPAKRAVSGIDKTAHVTSHPPTMCQKVGSVAVIQCHSSYFFLGQLICLIISVEYSLLVTKIMPFIA